ncbi:MAG: phytanoyl-CoA dioxygenase family protein [Chloroflexi bacterium]|nr:phytanoyl-CoA dioxygenase family protein [Chloroflexota bacterium]
MAVTGKKVYDGLTDHVTAVDEAARIRQTLYRVDETARATIVPSFRARWTADDLAQYQSQGYVAMDGLLTPEDVAEAKAALADIAARRVWNEQVGIQEEPYYAQGREDGRVDDPELRIRKLWKFCQADARLARMSEHPRLVPLLDQLIGPGHRMIQDMALLKPPFHGAEKPWHQDTAYFDWTPLGGVIGVWIALDPATVDNGCMQVIPGSHAGGPTQHYHVRDCQLADDRVQVERAAVVPLAPGGALFFSGLLHHGTPPNVSGDRRRALQFHYAARDCTRMTIREHAALFDDGGAYAGCRDWDLEAGMSRARISI